MANTLVHKKSSTPGAVPTSGQLTLGELAVNVADGKLFLKKTDGTIVNVGAGGVATVESLQKCDLYKNGSSYLNSNYIDLVSSLNDVLIRQNL